MKENTFSETEAIRSDIDQTRRRMDDTMDALGDRLHGRHLVDEILGLFRRGSSDGDGNGAGQKLKRGADAALHAVVDTVKANPLPALVIGAGVAWMIYESRRDRSADTRDWSLADEGEPFSTGADIGAYENVYDPSQHVDRPLEFTGAEGAEGEGRMKRAAAKVGDTLAHAKDAIASKAASAGEQVKEKLHTARERAGELGRRAQERTREAYLRSRERVARTADSHPLELGLGVLAAGVLVGLLIPTPEKVNRVAGPRMDRLRDRTREAGREALEKGKRVAQAATQAVKDEAQAQGLSLERLRGQAAAVADSAKEAATETARAEGMVPEGLAAGDRRQGEPGNQSGSMGNPSTARPA